MDPVLVGAFITGVVAVIVAMITVRGQSSASKIASDVEATKVKAAENQALVDNWRTIATEAKAALAELRDERDRAVDHRDEEHALNLALTAANERLLAEINLLKEQIRNANLD